MAKMLQTEPPSSSIARLLDPVAASRAVQTIAVCDPEQADSPEDTAQPRARDAHSGASVKREIVLTRETDAILDHLLNLFRRQTCTRLSTSHVIRVMLLMTQLATDTLHTELARVGPLNLPSNARGRETERQRFESILAQALGRAVRAAGPDRA